MNREPGAGSCDNLLLFCARKLSQNSLGDRRRRLNCKGIHEHAGRGCHFGPISAQRATACPYRGEILVESADRKGKQFLGV